MAWPPPPPPVNSSTRPTSFEFFRSTREKFAAVPSPMLSSPSSTSNGGQTSRTGKRESAPPALHIFTSSASLEAGGGSDQQHPAKLRPRSNSHVQIPLFSPATAHRPLPALPMSGASAVTSRDLIKVPIEGEHNSRNSTHSIKPSGPNRLHPKGDTRNRHSPQSPQFRPQELVQPTAQHGGPGPGTTEPRVVDYQRSIEQQQDSPVSGKLQPYYPPPPPVIASSQHPRQQGHSAQIDSAQKKTATNSPSLVESTMTTGTLPRPAANRSRRHSSGSASLSIQTQHLSSIKRGPSTADVGTTGARYLEPETVAKGTARKHLRSILPIFKQTSPTPASHLPPRQSPSHLVIPPPSRYQPPSQANQQYYSPSQHQQPQQQHQAYQYPSERSQTQTQHHHHLPQQQQQMQQRHHTSPGRSPNSSRATSPSRSTGLLESLQNRTAMALMQRYLSQPDDPDSEADITMQILISQAAVDAKGFEVLVPQTVESIKRHHATLSSRIAALTARLSLESKIREAAQSLLTLHADNKKLARQASDHLEAANRKVDQVATELWKLTQLAADLQRTLLQHTSGVLALGVVRLEDQARREREAHALQIEELSAEQDLEEQVALMSTTIQSLETDALEAQGLLEEKDRTIERLMKQLEHQRELFVNMDEQQQKTMVLSRLQQKTLDALGSNDTDVSKAAYLPRQSQDSCALARVREDSISSAPSDGDLTGTVTATVSEMTTVGSKGPNTPPGSGEKLSSPPHYSIDRITSVLDALESHVSESQQKMQVLEGELGLLRRHSVVLSASRNNSIRVKATPPSSTRSHAEDTIRTALEKSLKDALLEKEMARQELENERQRWQDDQNHRISALEQSLVAVEDAEKNTVSVADSTTGANGAHSSTEETIQALRSQLREAIDEIDTLNQQQQSSNKSMRQLFDLVPDHRRKNHMQLLTSHQHLQQQIANSNNGHSGAGGRGSPGRTSPYGQFSQISGRASPAGSVSSSSSGGAVGFSMDALIARVKELVAHSQQLDQDNVQLRQQFGRANTRSRQASGQSPLIRPLTMADSDTHEQPDQHSDKLSAADDLSPQPQPPAHSTWILNSELERLQASSGMIQLLEKELELLKQHTDMLLDENARLAELAAASATGVSTASSRGSTSEYGGLSGKSTADGASDLQEIIRIKDKLLQERDQLVREQDVALQRLQSQLADAAGPYGNKNGWTDGAESNALPVMSSFDVAELEEFRIKCGKLEEQVGEMRMIIAALESVNGGPGSGAQLLQALSSSQTSPPGSWFSSGLGLSSAMGSLNFGSLTLKQQQTQPDATASGVSSPIPSNVEAFYNQKRSQEGTNESARSLKSSSANSSSINLAVGSGSSNAAVAGATAALRKEFRRVMAELREEKEKAVRKEVEERRRLERTVRQLRRELQAVQNSTHSS
ncbi:hypothetical protein KVV02_002419 [Mortierella alpina]|uniref:Up-regulated during septation protein 1 domain-containing protein n=1 Tax=Mortierella alpina TaxID=64518 RepID=A0A9P8CWG7_MORAP|nr:hypothetical protein KVV02_002419 [Mortierella alpina]